MAHCNTCNREVKRRKKFGPVMLCPKCYAKATVTDDEIAAATRAVKLQFKPGLANAFRATRTVGTAPHVIVEARAGTGKTTTLVEGLKVLKGIGSPLRPSPQQDAVWQAMLQSEGQAETVCFVAFNKSIATELQERVPPGCAAMTMHSLGFKSVARAFGKVRVSSYRVQDIISEILESDIRELRKHQSEMIRATEKLVGLCKMNLVGNHSDHSSENEFSDAYWEQSLNDLAAYYDVDLNGSASDVFSLVRKVLERCKDVSRDRTIDFDDMVWLPVALGLSVDHYDLLLVDEAQDLNRCQQALCMMVVGDTGRLVLCGDPKQAIYGFAGADAESINRMEDLLKRTDHGCVRLPLTVTRRCGKAIVAEAQTIVPDFEAHETCGPGKISKASIKDVRYKGKAGKGTGPIADRAYDPADGDMVLCRVNAPLVSHCFRFIKAGRKANIQGRDVGQGLVSTVKKSRAVTVEEFLVWLDDWYHSECQKESRKRMPNDAKLIALEDRKECLEAFCEDSTTCTQVVEKIEKIFTDDKDATGIKLSSVHKAKGLEADRVFILLPENGGMPHPMAKSAWQKDQEMNLKYVAITRAKTELVWVS